VSVSPATARAVPRVATGIGDGDLIAAVDIGSNSFHLVVARYEHGRLRMIDRMREAVHLAMGLRADGSLDAERRALALSCLARFGQRLRAVPAANVRAVATNAVRRLAHPQAFLVPAETALGHAIGVVSGREEARLIHLGIAHARAGSPEQRLVVDVGGGSTEFIIGQGFETLETESVQIGCIASTLRFFPDGHCTAQAWQRARTGIGVELQQFAAAYRARGWVEAMASSGTARCVAAIAQANGWCDTGISAAALARLREAILAAGRVDRLDLAGLAEERRATLAGGVAILDAVFTTFGLEHVSVCDTAMREGLLFDLVGPAMHGDPRAASVGSLAARYGVDRAQAARVRHAAMTLFDQVADAWDLVPVDRDFLGWAADVHEVGLAIAHSKHHVHGAYIIAHSDLEGFSRDGQQALAAMVRSHRRNPHAEAIAALPGRLQERVRRLTVLLRLAALLERARTIEPLPLLSVHARGDRLTLRLPATWLDQHPLTRADLATEQVRLRGLGMTLDAVAGAERGASGA